MQPFLNGMQPFLVFIFWIVNLCQLIQNKILDQKIKLISNKKMGVTPKKEAKLENHG